MGDRGNVQIVMDNGRLPGEDPIEESIWVYSHWSGTELPQLAGVALAKAQGRWGDPSYGARIVVTNLIGHVEGDTGWGIDVRPGDTGDGGRVVRIDFRDQTVKLITNRHGESAPMSFQEYISGAHRVWPGYESEDENEDY